MNFMFLRRTTQKKIHAIPGNIPPLARVDDGVRVYVIGDIHGRDDLVRKICNDIRKDSETMPFGMKKIAVFLGDYLDRGMNSREVIDFLVGNPLPGFDIHFLKGNHEQKLLDFLEDFEEGGAWLELGGGATVFSYGVRVPKEVEVAGRLKYIHDAFRGKLPDSHHRFLKNLEIQHTIGDYLFVHAGVNPKHPLDDQNPNDIIWGVDEFLDFDDDLDKVVVHGHSTNLGPIERNNRIGIDTGAYFTDDLTCLVLEEGERRFLSTKRPA